MKNDIFRPGKINSSNNIGALENSYHSSEHSSFYGKNERKELMDIKTIRAEIAKSLSMPANRYEFLSQQKDLFKRKMNKY